MENIIPTQEEIQEEAYHVWETRGRPEGKDLQNWLIASRTIHYDPKIRHEQREAFCTLISAMEEPGGQLHIVQIFDIADQEA